MKLSQDGKTVFIADNIKKVFFYSAFAYIVTLIFLAYSSITIRQEIHESLWTFVSISLMLFAIPAVIHYRGQSDDQTSLDMGHMKILDKVKCRENRREIRAIINCIE